MLTAGASQSSVRVLKLPFSHLKFDVTGQKLMVVDGGVRRRVV